MKLIERLNRERGKKITVMMVGPEVYGCGILTDIGMDYIEIDNKDIFPIANINKVYTSNEKG